jgi:hypothetical protein
MVIADDNVTVLLLLIAIPDVMVIWSLLIVVWVGSFCFSGDMSKKFVHKHKHGYAYRICLGLQWSDRQDPVHNNVWQRCFSSSRVITHHPNTCFVESWTTCCSLWFTLFPSGRALLSWVGRHVTLFAWATFFFVIEQCFSLTTFQHKRTRLFYSKL